jgi:putative cell wall-binding protein
VNGHIHEFTEDAPVFDPETNTHSRYCTSCDMDVAESCTFIPAITTDASVTEAGVTTRTCSVCGGSYETYFYLRLMGSNRYETAFLAADQLKIELGVEEFENIIVASGTGFADALAGSYLAVVKNAPILLVNSYTVTDVAEYIGENLASGGTVYLLGGNAAVPASMEAELEGLYVERLAGANRYETNLMILEEAGFAGEEILVCTGNGFADSLSASAVGKPILLVNKSLNAAQLEFLEVTSGEFVIIGGESAVSAAVENKLDEYGEVSRLAGANRYETSVLVAERFFDAPTSAVVAYSQNFPDGLCGGPLAAATDSPLLLMATNRGDNVIEYAQEVGISSGAVLGGTGLIDDATAKNLFSMN